MTRGYLRRVLVGAGWLLLVAVGFGVALVATDHLRKLVIDALRGLVR